MFVSFMFAAMMFANAVWLFSLATSIAIVWLCLLQRFISMECFSPQSLSGLRLMLILA
ncbi:hypothetical protein BH11PSE12_BH11PSE12_00900 [soil metagenome]